MSDYFVQSLSHVWLFATPWTAAHQASLSSTMSQRLLKLMSIESVMPSNHLIFGGPLLFLPSIFPNIKVSIEPGSPALQADSLPSDPPGKPHAQVYSLVACVHKLDHM